MTQDNQPAAGTGSSLRKSISVRSHALACIPATLDALNSFDTQARRAALAESVRCFEAKEISRPQETGWANVLARTFFSYSAEGFSPSRLAWEAVIRGLSVIGCLDLDNLGALSEIFAAGDSLGVRTTASLETVVHAPAYRDRDTNRPGRPGTMLALGVGFARVPDPHTPHGELIASLPVSARRRNLALTVKANGFMTPVTLDYAADVLPLAPAGNATDRHVAAAFIKKAEAQFPELDDRAVFWADVLGRSPKDVEGLLADPGPFLELVADKLNAAVGPGAAEAEVNGYPDVSVFYKAVKASGAVPCLPWLGGMSEGEADPERLLDDAMSWGVRAVALQPERAWNVVDPGEKARRLQAMAGMVEAARKRHLPVLAGSKMDRPRQKFMDSMNAPELSPYLRDFSDSAFWLYGHTVMERADANGLASAWAKRHFGRDYAAANAFYLEVGKKAKPEAATRARLADLGPEAGPGDVLNALG